MKLDKVRPGECVKILSISDDWLKELAVRMGIDEGEVLSCVGVVPAGPLVLSKHRQEIAVGRDLARHINVELLARAGQARTCFATPGN